MMVCTVKAVNRSILRSHYLVSFLGKVKRETNAGNSATCFPITTGRIIVNILNAPHRLSVFVVVFFGVFSIGLEKKFRNQN